MKITLASPVYNESEKIQEFIQRSAKALYSISDDVEIILVNDYSSDDTLEKIREILPQYPCVKLINLTKNSGQYISTSLALKHATGDYVFMMDSDLQISPEYMVEFFDFGKQNPKWDVISALRTSRSKKLLRRVGSVLISKFMQKIGKSKLKDPGSSFKLLKRNALDKVLSHDILAQNYPILMMNLTLTILEYPIKYNIVQNRESHYKFSDLISVMVLALLNFSTGGSTLVFLIFLGMLLTLGGVFGVAILIILGMVNHSILPQNLLIFLLVLTLIGLQFLLLGMVAYKLERINRNLDFRKSMNQRVEYEN